MHSAAPYGEGQQQPNQQNTGPFPGAQGVPSAPPASVPPVSGRRARLGDLLVLGGGLIIFMFSFAPFASYSDAFVNDVNRESSQDFDGWFMAWSTQTFMAPLTWWIIFAGLLLVALAGWRILTAGDPELLRFRSSQLQVGLALFAFFALLGYALSNKQVFFGLDELLDVDGTNLFGRPPGFAWGGILMLLGAVIASVGAVLNLYGIGPSFSAPTPTAAGQQWPNAGPGYPQQPGPTGTYPGQPQYQQPTSAYPQPEAPPQYGSQQYGVQPPPQDYQQQPYPPQNYPPQQQPPA